MKRMIPLALFVVILAGCSKPPRPDIVFVTVDTLRKDHVGRFGGGDLTPRIDSLLADSVVLEDCRTVVPITFPSYASLFTGHYPRTHGVQFNTGFTIPEEIPTLTELLKGTGYATGAFIGGNPLHAGKGLERGFDRYDDAFLRRPATRNPLFRIERFEQAMGEMSHRPAEDITALALDFIQSAPQPLFLFLHYYDPHTPYSPPEAYLRERPDNPYAAEVRYTDESIGRLLEGLKAKQLYDGALIVFLSDHGESLGEHGEDTHGYYLYDSTVAVPAAFKLPAMRRVGAVPGPTSLLNIAPTVADLLGLPFAAQGTSLKKALLKGGEIPARDLLLATRMPKLYFGLEELTGIVSTSRKGVFSSEPAVYDLITDPTEKANLYPEQFRELRQRHKALLESLPEAEAAMGVASGEDVRKLQSLGYISPNADLPPVNLPPSRWGEIISIYEQGNTAFYHGDYAGAVGIYTRRLQTQPGDFRILMERGMVLAQWGKTADAIADFKAALTVLPDAYEVYDNLLRSLVSLGDYAELERLLPIVEGKFPGDLQIQGYRVALLKRQGRLEQAAALVRASLDLQPQMNLLHMQYLDLLFAAKDDAAIRGLVKRESARGGVDTAIKAFYQGMAHLLENKREDALKAFVLSGDMGADFHQPYAQAGLLLKGAQQFKEAAFYFKAAALLAPQSAQWLYEWSDTQAAQGNLPAAYEGFKRTLTIDGQSVAAHMSLMKIAWLMKKMHEAQIQYEWLVKNAPGSLRDAQKNDKLVQAITM